MTIKKIRSLMNNKPMLNIIFSRYVFARSHGIMKQHSPKGASPVASKVSKKRLNKTVCVVDPGYVGLPLAEAFSEHLRMI